MGNLLTKISDQLSLFETYREILVVSALSGANTVALGAFGAHVLKKLVHTSDWACKPQTSNNLRGLQPLRVPTTRALCVVTTGEKITRAWYDDHGRERIGQEPGAVGTRVAPSFLRFGQLELFYQRKETALLYELAEHALKRDFAHLCVQVTAAAIAHASCFASDLFCSFSACVFSLTATSPSSVSAFPGGRSVSTWSGT